VRRQCISPPPVRRRNEMAVEAAGCLDGFELRAGLIRRLLMWANRPATVNP